MTATSVPVDLQRAARLAILVAALGYFVDIYDMVIFSVVRAQSLEAIGVPAAERMSAGVRLLNMQMLGMLAGGILWGVLGDKRGRLSVLFGSIFLYSTANFANGFVQTMEQYALLRVLAGIGLAGELGAGITLVSELMSKEHRGYGTTLVATNGVMGAIAAALVGSRLDWRSAYMVGGGLGFALLCLRMTVHEPRLFTALKDQAVQRGNFLRLLKPGPSARRYLSVVLVGVPIWFVIGVLITFAPEFGKALGMKEIPLAAHAVLIGNVGTVLGDLASGLFSQFTRSRKRSVALFLVLGALATVALFTVGSTSLWAFYACCGALGFSAGYMAVLVTIAAEQFGTNLRATAATTVPNFIRGSTVLLTSGLQLATPSLGLKGAALVVGGAALVAAFAALRGIDETFGRDLDFLEE
ncbi:MFS transporter [Pyxidicoccus caerfyrddinensis]|uniref:MFS transporter n=1 Tax=Pyxidicoccus caerfyrddinensis TaxID=2709663 RepID=UPI0013D8EDFE|nr:MFS transporter [Pyxidicoccus caerfyrddinensis]